MRVSIDWLKDYVNFNMKPADLADLLTMAGVPVENIVCPGEDIRHVVTGKLTAVYKHPHADRLYVCQVNTGSKILTIVTGATNVRAGQVVPVALPGASLAGGKHITVGEFRGTVSEGMLCSGEELGLDTKVLPPEQRGGIYILPAGTPVGVDVKPILGLDDVILEFELTANRADCFSVIGIAREVAALTGASLQRPILSLKEDGSCKTSTMATVTITDPSLCPRFAARILENVRIAPSPLWLQKYIQAAGMRPINNVVDVTNFVMWEMGQPMHAYDYELLAGHAITVRRAQAGEKLTTLDGVQRSLTEDMIVIADATQAVGLAGVMGGLATEVTAGTKTVLLEAAAFHGPSIRRTSRALGLRSEASARFERGVDVAAVENALDRAAQLLENMGACRVCPGVVDNYPGVALPRQIKLEPERINSFLGTAIPAAQMLTILRRLEFNVTGTKPYIVTVPSWRSDVEGEADLAEEIGRLYGYDKIPATMPTGVVRQGGESYEQQVYDVIRKTMVAMGLTEVITYSFTNQQEMDKLRIPLDAVTRRSLTLRNPIVDEFQSMRTMLLGGLLTTAARNLARRVEDMKIFEIGAVYWPETLPPRDLPAEPMKMAGIFTGQRQETVWCQSPGKCDFFDAKGVLEQLLSVLGIKDYAVKAGLQPFCHPGKCATLLVQDMDVGWLGEVHPAVTEAFGLTLGTVAFEIALAPLVQAAQLVPCYQPLPRFPAVKRDLALLVPTDVNAAAVTAAIQQAGGSLLTQTSLFDVYTGEQVLAGYRSLAYALTFQAPDRTLTEQEITASLEQIVIHLQNTLSVKLRA